MISALEVALLVMVLDRPPGGLICDATEEGVPAIVQCTNGRTATETGTGRIAFDGGILVEKTPKGELVFSNGISATRTAIGWIRFSNGVMARTTDRRSYTFGSGQVCETVSLTRARCRPGTQP